MQVTETLENRIQKLQSQLGSFMLPIEIDEITSKIRKIHDLKKNMNVVILGHNYMVPEVFHGVSDFTGDSLALAVYAEKSQSDIILFNGVHFMAETAKILNPTRKVLIADADAGCSLSESITGEDVRQMKEKYPGIPVVTYINCSAEVKAETDIICTSANAAKVVNSLEADTVMLLPDYYLSANVQKQNDKKIISWPGKCMVHELYTPMDIQMARRHHPGVKVITHPECPPSVTEQSDFSGSTSQMGEYIRTSGAGRVMLLTECSMGDNLRSEFPKVEFVSTCQTCPHMKKITLDKIITALENQQFEVDVPEHIRIPAKKAVDRMLAIGR